MTQVSALVAEPCEQDVGHYDEPVSAELIAAADDAVRPGRRVPSLGILETRPLTDRERLEVMASLYWYATRGGC